MTVVNKIQRNGSITKLAFLKSLLSDAMNAITNRMIKAIETGKVIQKRQG